MSWFKKALGRETGPHDTSSERHGQGPYRGGETPDNEPGPLEMKSPEEIRIQEAKEEPWPDIELDVGLGPRERSNFIVPEIPEGAPEIPDGFREGYEKRGERWLGDAILRSMAEDIIESDRDVRSGELPIAIALASAEYIRPLAADATLDFLDLERSKEIVGRFEETVRKSKDYLKRILPTLNRRSGTESHSFGDLEKMAKNDPMFRSRHFGLMKRDTGYRDFWETARTAQIALAASEPAKGMFEIRAAEDEVALEDSKETVARAAESWANGEMSSGIPDQPDIEWLDEKVPDFAASMERLIEDLTDLPRVERPKAHSGEKTAYYDFDDATIDAWRESMEGVPSATYELARLKAEREIIQKRLDDAMRAMKENHGLTRHDMDVRVINADPNQTDDHERRLKTDPSYGFDIGEIQEYEKLLNRYPREIETIEKFLDVQRELAERAAVAFLKPETPNGTAEKLAA